MNVIGYVRISKADRNKSEADQRHSINAQRGAIERAAEDNDWDLLAIYEDFAKSGANTRRAELQEALGRLKRKEAAMLVVARNDRLSRDTRDWLDLLFDSSQQGWAISVLDQRIDTSTASGWLHAVLQAVFSEYERRIIGERTKAALDVVRQTKTLGRPSRIPADIQEQILALHDDGLSATAIAELLQTTGVPTPTSRSGRWHHSHVLACIRRNTKEAS